MQQIYQSNPSYNINAPILNTQTKFFLNNEGRLCRIVRYYAMFDGIRERAWGNETKEKWNLDEDGNEYDLIRAFTELALGNPKDFRTLYYTLKEHDDVTFPCIEQDLQQVQETFNFN